MNVDSTLAATTPTPPHERFLGALSPEMRRQVLALPGILEAHADYFLIFTARKSVCIADALRRLGYWSPAGDFSSTRALDGDTTALAGRKVLIIEDLAASCRTLSSAIAAVREAQASEIRCFALSVEGPQNEWRNHLGVEFATPYLDSDIDDSTRHARAIVGAFAALPRPYNIDWPMLALPEAVTPEMAADAGWRRLGSADPEFGAVSLEPSEALAPQLDKVLPDWLGRVLREAHLSKIRLYPVSDPQPNGTHTFAVPIVALGAMRRPDIDATLYRLCEAVGTEPIRCHSAREGYRILEFLLGGVFLEIFAGSLDLDAPAHPDGAAEFLFMPGVRERVIAAQHRIERWAATLQWPQVSDRTSVDMLLWDDLHAATHQREEADRFIADLFLERYVRSEEYKLRRELRGARYGDRDRIARQLRDVVRSEDGASFTAGELSERLAEASSRVVRFADPKQLVSGFLDRGIDGGEVVPEIDETDGVVTRRFRPGEIINFERDTQAQVEAMLRSFAHHAERATLSADLLQKLVVGYVGYLLRLDKIADRSPSGPSLRDVDRLQRRYHLRGAVLDEVSADFVADNPLPYVTKVLLSAGVIDEAPGGGYALADAPVLEGHANHPVDAIGFGHVLAEIMELRGDDGGHLLDEDHLARLITLSSPVEQMQALAADLIIASGVLRGDVTLDRGAAKSRPFTQGLNNGLAKANWIAGTRSHALLKALRKRLETSAGPYDVHAALRASVLDAFSPRGAESDAKQLVRRLIDWFRATHLWDVTAEALATEDLSAQAISAGLKNRAFLAIGGTETRWRGYPASSRLCAALRRDPPDTEGLRRLVSDVHLEVVDMAASLREQAYDMAARSGTGPSRTAPIDACILLRLGDNPVKGLTSIPGVSPALRPASREGERLLSHYDLIVPLKRSFDLGVRDEAVLDFLRDARADAMLIEGLPPRFQLTRDPARTLAFVQHAFLDLLDAWAPPRGEPGQLSVLVPARCTTATASAVREHGSLHSIAVVVGCEWEHWSYSRPSQQLALPSANADADPPAPRATDPAPSQPHNVNFVVIHVDEAHVSIDARQVCADLDMLTDALAREKALTPEEAHELEMVKKKIEDGDRSWLQRWGRKAAPRVVDGIQDLGLEALKRVLGL
ncbi:MAG: hypothetical protein QOF51_1444 [Chloroflexota bacterium]|nr:hypothetical protein [Chloroflexota bacterium]